LTGRSISEERGVSELAIELPFRKAGQLDDELDYQMPLAPNQVSEAAVEIARGGRFHSNPLTRVFLPSCEGARRPWAHATTLAAFRRPAACARAAGRDARALMALSRSAALTTTGSWRQAVKRKDHEINTTATNLLGSSHLTPKALRTRIERGSNRVGHEGRLALARTSPRH
jgi:hypothetical protein